MQLIRSIRTSSRSIAVRQSPKMTHSNTRFQDRGCRIEDTFSCLLLDSQVQKSAKQWGSWSPRFIQRSALLTMDDFSCQIDMSSVPLLEAVLLPDTSRNCKDSLESL